MIPLTLPRLILKRLLANRTLLASIFVSIALAITLLAASPTYLKALDRLALNLEIGELTRPFSNVHVYGANILLTSEKLEDTERAINKSIRQHLLPIYDRHERYLIVDEYLAGIPNNPLPLPGSQNRLASRAYFRHLSNLEHHVHFVNGHMAGTTTTSNRTGPTIEAIVGMKTASSFDLNVGDKVTVTTHLTADKKIHVRIVGIVTPIDPNEDYWMPHASVFLNPPPITEGPVNEEIEYNSDEPPIPLFVSQEAMVNAIGEAYPGSLITSIWYVLIETEPLKAWSIKEIRRRLDDFETDILRTMPGSQTFTGIRTMLSSFEKRQFFVRLPLLLLLAVIAMTLFFYLIMMVSYLIYSRKKDIALMKGRGVSFSQLLRLYSIEGMVVSIVSVILAPFLAMAVVALAGMTPYFRSMTKDGLLPVQMGPIPFTVAAGAGLLCILIFLIPNLAASRGGILTHKLETSRPPATPFFNRYYLDVGLLALGSFIFWELRSREHFLSGGLFNEFQVNETLLLAPVLFMIAVGLVFMRVFPLITKYVAGESPALLHLAAFAVILCLPSLVVISQIQEPGGIRWLLPAILPLVVGYMSWSTSRAESLKFQVVSVIFQTILVWGFVSLEPLTPGQAQFAPTIVLISLIPGQILYIAFRASSQISQVWLTLGLWQIARNPLSYTWIILLLVIVTGISILTTSIGGTLKRSQEDRVNYDVATDFRITGLNELASDGIEEMRSRYLRIPSVSAASLALRYSGHAGPTEFEILGLEPTEFSRMSWYREDFSDQPLGTVMLALQSHAQIKQLSIPEHATTIGIWVKPEEVYTEMYVWTVLQDSTGDTRTLSLGTVGNPEWQLLENHIPKGLDYPVHVVSVQISEPSIGPNPRLTPGAILFDDIHVTFENTSKKQVLEGFEGQIKWLPIITNALSSDHLRLNVDDVHQGRRAAIFRFGKETIRGIRGFYQSPTGGPMPVIVSTAFSKTTGTGITDQFLVEIDGQRLPVVIRNIVHYFPTMSTGGGNFMLVELDNLLSHLNISRPVTTLYPNELFLSQAPTVHQQIGTPDLGSIKIQDRSDMLRTLRRDPYTNAGWGSLVLLALGISLLTTVLGYVTYILLSSDRRRHEMVFLQSLGLSPRQTIYLLAFEHLTIGAIGLALGTWTGFQMSRIVVSTLAVTETGGQVLPPFIMMTDWSLMAPTYVAMITILLGALYVLTRNTRRLDLGDITKIKSK